MTTRKSTNEPNIITVITVADKDGDPYSCVMRGRITDKDEIVTRMVREYNQDIQPPVLMTKKRWLANVTFFSVCYDDIRYL